MLSPIKGGCLPSSSCAAAGSAGAAGAAAGGSAGRRHAPLGGGSHALKRRSCPVIAPEYAGQPAIAGLRQRSRPRLRRVVVHTTHAAHGGGGPAVCGAGDTAPAAAAAARRRGRGRRVPRVDRQRELVRVRLAQRVHPRWRRAQIFGVQGAVGVGERRQPVQHHRRRMHTARKRAERP
jgi:hypothetical protein